MADVRAGLNPVALQTPCPVVPSPRVLPIIPTPSPTWLWGTQTAVPGSFPRGGECLIHGECPQNAFETESSHMHTAAASCSFAEEAAQAHGRSVLTQGLGQESPSCPRL